MRKLTLLFSTYFMGLPSLFAQSRLPKDAEAIYWYGVAVILGLFTMFGLIAALTNLYTQKTWLNKTAFGLALVNIALGIGGVALYIKHSAVGWIAFMPMATAVVGGLMVMSKQPRASNNQ